MASAVEAVVALQGEDAAASPGAVNQAPVLVEGAVVAIAFGTARAPFEAFGTAWAHEGGMLT